MTPFRTILLSKEDYEDTASHRPPIYNLIGVILEENKIEIKKNRGGEVDTIVTFDKWNEIVNTQTKDWYSIIKGKKLPNSDAILIPKKNNDAIIVAHQYEDPNPSDPLLSISMLKCDLCKLDGPALFVDPTHGEQCGLTLCFDCLSNIMKLYKEYICPQQ